MPKLHHYYGPNHLQFLTRSTYRRTRVYDSERFKNHGVGTLGGLRQELGFRIVGYVLMPEHFLCGRGKTLVLMILQNLEDRTALFVVKNLKQNLSYSWCRGEKGSGAFVLGREKGVRSLCS